MWSVIGLVLGFVHIAFAIVYLYLTWHHNYWKKRGMVTAKPFTILGTYPGVLGWGKRGLVLDVQEVYNKYRGKHRAVGTFLTRAPQLLILDPALAHEILVTNFNHFRDTISSSFVGHNKDDKYVARNPFFSAGESWKKRRTEGGGGLTANRLKLGYAIWQESGQRLLKYMERAIAEKGNIIETRDLSYRFMANTMGDFIWGIDAGSLTCNVEEQCEFQKVSTAWAFIAFQSITKFNRTLVAPFMRKLLQLRLFTKETDAFYLQLTQQAVKLRQNGNGSNRADYLSHLIQLQQKGNTMDDTVGHALTVLMDGYETSGAVLYHLLYSLSEYHEVQEKLRTEILDALGDDKIISYEELVALPYLDQCVNESLRLTSPIGFLMKICTRPTQIDVGNDKTLKLEAGVSVLIPAFQFHHDEALYPQANEFKPERFATESATEFTKRGMLLPFGDGPRICLGMRVGQLNVKTAVVQILSQYKIRQTKKLPMSSDSGLGLFLDGDIELEYIKL
ncbi:probable cytochrome P450 309a1 [Drosophila tropicalis]|uniref:probable cytochrome P450 309a1 n=1 Tax=Drosophila tropicalis TaxID=46794 RepID=UPI0035ABA94C